MHIYHKIQHVPINLWMPTNKFRPNFKRLVEETETHVIILLLLVVGLLLLGGRGIGGGWGSLGSSWGGGGESLWVGKVLLGLMFR